MADPIADGIDKLAISGWMARAPDTGRAAAFLLLAPPHDRAAVTMPLVAMALGLDTRPGAVTPDVTKAVVWIGADQWIHLELAGRTIATRPMSPEWTATARTDGRVVLVCGYEPMPVGMHTETYADQIMWSHQMSIGLITLANPPARADHPGRP